jgi:hypothetical protein
MIKRPLTLCGLCWLAVGSPLNAELPDGYQTIYLDRQASPPVAAAAADLADLLHRTYGQVPDIRRDPFMVKPKGLTIGPDPDNPAFDSDPLTDEILIERTPRGLEIRGSDNTTTTFAIFRFAEEFLGWRYYQPGQIGLERLDNPPAPPAIDGSPEMLLLTRADYISRNPYSLDPGSAGLPDWRTWHGLRERLQYNHTLHRVIPPTRFDTDPHWFAKDDSGKPMRPPYYPRVHGYNDHPDLSRQEVRDFVAAETIAAIEAASPFSKDGKALVTGDPVFPHILQTPGALSVSLSLGDSFVFGEFPEAYPWRPEGYFRRWPDWSNHVFAYTNSVAARIERQWNEGTWTDGARPDLLLGALAYLNWENVPNFPLHPSIVPYLTYDRSQWYDPQARADDLDNVAAWNRTSAPFLGTWDYLFGYGFIIPRSMTRIVAESIPALHERGVRAYFCQIAAVWPYDGHTNWLLTRLLWDAGADPDRLIDEYFREFYGPAAASMRAFFDHAESIWMNQDGSGWWLRYWKDPWQVALYAQADLEAMGRHLEAAAQAAAQFSATTPESGLSISRFSERVHQTRLMFELTRALFNYQSTVWEAQSEWRNSSQEVDVRSRQLMFEQALDAREALVQARDKVVQSLPNARRAGDLTWVFRYESTGGALAAFCLDYPDLPGNADLLRRWARLQGFADTPRVQNASGNILFDDRIRHFEDPRIWHRQFMDSEGMRAGPLPEQGMAVENVRRGHAYQLFRAAPGNVYLGEADVRTRQSASGEVYIKVDFFNEKHELIAESPRGRIAPTAQYGEQQQVRVLMQAPAQSAYGRLFIRFYEMDPGSRAEVTRAAVYRLDSGATP